MSKQFSFNQQLELGDRGEQLFLQHYPHKLEIHPGRDGDFIEVCSGKKIELKTDNFNIDKTPNFFIERYSDIHRKSPGSVWQAIEHGCEIFCYMFIRHNIYYQFNDLPALAAKLEKMIEGKGYIPVKNNGWITAGYKILREDLKEFYDIYEF